jgi:hypothetical protein
MAAAHVTGSWAVLKEKYPGDSIEDTLCRLRVTGADLLDSRNNYHFPRINLYNALTSNGLATAWVNPGYLNHYENGSLDYPFRSLLSGIVNTSDGGTVKISSQLGGVAVVQDPPKIAGQWTISSSVTIEAIGGPATISVSNSAPCYRPCRPIDTIYPTPQDGRTCPLQ